MSMSPSKASKLLKEYELNNHNAYKTLIENGYSKNTAKAEGGKVIERARRVVTEKLNLKPDTKENTARTVLEILGYNENDVLKELKKVIEQDRDFTNKLKALKPALRDVGINLEDEESGNKVAVLNIGVKEVDTETQKTPQQSHTIEIDN